MRNSPGLPFAALLVAAALAVPAALWQLVGGGAAAPLSELEIGLYAWAFVLSVFGVQGLVSIMLEGAELRPARQAPRLTGVLSAAIVVLSALLLLLAVLLGGAILSGQPVSIVGSAAGGGCLVLMLLLVAYKEAFVGDEARLDPRKDGVPW